MIYLDSPAGVGLSYSKNVSDYQTGDLKTAADSHTFLLKVYAFMLAWYITNIYAG
jgi:serine carboxypeptidase-like clade 1